MDWGGPLGTQSHPTYVIAYFTYLPFSAGPAVVGPKQSYSITQSPLIHVHRYDHPWDFILHTLLCVKQIVVVLTSIYSEWLLPLAKASLRLAYELEPIYASRRMSKHGIISLRSDSRGALFRTTSGPDSLTGYVSNQNKFRSTTCAFRQYAFSAVSGSYNTTFTTSYWQSSVLALSRLQSFFGLHRPSFELYQTWFSRRDM